MKVYSLILCLLLILFASCSDKETIGTADKTVWHEKKVIVVLPMSDGLNEHWQNTFSLFSESIKKAFLNQKEGIQLDFEFHDETSENVQELATEIVNRNDVYAVIGGLYSKNAKTLRWRQLKNL
ncbi:MAG: hypothetical protein LUC45_02015 [Paraprevotella sp.]|nr:hypothetical protein [Paraprevotella sp.]